MSELPLLLIFGGAPGCGKTTVARELARKIRACHLRIDTLEQALVRSGCCAPDELEGKGYRIACELAKDQLANHLSVIADCVNPWELTRNWWRALADEVRCRTIEVEFQCSDTELHRQRVEQRACDIPGMTPPDWENVRKRIFEPWNRAHLILDTAKLSAAESVARIRAYAETQKSIY